MKRADSSAKTEANGRGGAAPHLALIAVQILFGSWPIAGKLALTQLTTASLVAFRVAGAAIAFLVLQTIAGRVRITRRSDYARLALYSLLGVVLNQLLFVKGLALTTVINATLLSTTIPIFALIVSITLGYDRANFKKLLGITLAAAGAIYLIDPLRADFSHQTTLGNLLIVANSLSYAAYIAISKDMLKRYGALTVITWIFIFGSFATIPFGLYYTNTAAVMHTSMRVWLAVVYIILMPTVGAYYLNAWALQRVAPSTVAAYIYLQPLIAFALAPLILGERWNSRAWVAMLLIFSGVFVVTRRDRSYAIEEVSEHPEAIGH
ncbi:MAG: DMT family transporter [Acidobacteria bacterium]|nr:DMT family transporter [Acidobacteriota bacterium]